jgi:hypothetical protein
MNRQKTWFDSRMHNPYVRIKQYPGIKQRSMIIGLLLLGAGLAALMFWSFATRTALLMSVLVLAFTVVFALLAHFKEPIKGARRSQRVRNIFNPRLQSWAFLADMFGLAPALGFAVAGWDQIHTWAFHQWWWLALVSAAVGIAASLAFHWFMDRPGCLSENPNALRSPTKVWHNWVTYPVLFSAMWALCVPYLFSRHGYFWPVLVFTGVWFAGVGFDALRGMIPRWKLSARNLHIPWDEQACKPLVR